MAKFLLIDHSLKSIGGHHYDYAMHILHAAEQHGFEIHLATNRRFKTSQRPTNWHVYPTFRYDAYSQYSLSTSWPFRGRTGMRNQFREWRTKLQRKSYLRRFAEGVDKVLNTVKPVENDQVFVPTATEVDLMGLRPVLMRNRHACSWHLQLHFNFFDGRAPDYGSQADSFEAMQCWFQQALKGVATRRLYFYNTTSQLSDQYNRLGVADFQALPYPVNLSLRRETEHTAGSPLRVTCAGVIRAEKGQKNLVQVVHQLWNDQIRNGRMKLVVQSNKSRFHIPLPDEASTHTENSLIEYVKHPLSMGEYRSMLRNADVGLFMYDGERYYARCAGILVEMLTIGVPVVVPAGCWLAEQVAPAIFAHLESVWQEDDEATDVPLAWHRGGSPTEDGTIVKFSGENDATTLDFEKHANADTLCIRFRWKAPLQPGSYVRAELQQRGENGESIPCRSAIVGHHQEGGFVYAAFPLLKNTKNIALKLSNAYCNETIELSDFEIQQSDNQSGPLGKVGLIAAEPGDVAGLLAEIGDNYSHYQQSAAAFSDDWAQQHAPSRTVEQIVSQANISETEIKCPA